MMKENPIEFRHSWFHNPSSMERLWGIHPLASGRNVAKPNYKVGPRIVPNYIVHLVMEGTVRFTSDDRQWILNKGDLFCSIPGLLQSHEFIPSDIPLQMVWLTFSGEQSLPLLEQLGLSPDQPCLFGLNLQRISPLFRQYEQTGENKSPLQKMVAFMKIIDAIFSQRTEVSDDFTGSWLQQSIQFMESHYTEDIEVRDVAAYAKVDRSHFTKTFSDKIGISPSTFLRNLRLDRGVELLKETNLSVSEIAYSLGYHDVSSFTRSFRNRYKAPPTSVRDNSTIDR